MKIIIDADACPRSVLLISLQAGEKEGIPVWTVASFNHNIQSDRHIVVADDPQATDIKVLNKADKGDIVVTQDWGLAAMLLGKGVTCLSPDGREFKEDTIEFLLEIRESKAKHRRGGGRTRGPKKRTLEDDLRFEKSLINALINR